MIATGPLALVSVSSRSSGSSSIISVGGVSSLACTMTLITQPHLFAPPQPYLLAHVVETMQQNNARRKYRSFYYIQKVMCVYSVLYSPSLHPIEDNHPIIRHPFTSPILMTRYKNIYDDK